MIALVIGTSRDFKYFLGEKILERKLDKIKRDRHKKLKTLLIPPQIKRVFASPTCVTKQY